MGELSGGETKAGLEVAQQDFPLGVGLDRFQQLLVDGDLVSFTGSRWPVGLLLLGEDITFSLLGSPLPLSAEVGIVDGGRNCNLVDVQLGAGGNDEVLVDTTDGNTVHLVGPCKKNALLKFSSVQIKNKLFTGNEE